MVTSLLGPHTNSQHFVVRVRISVWAWIRETKRKEKTIFSVLIESELP
jgi:hypothetical protein